MFQCFIFPKMHSLETNVNTEKTISDKFPSIKKGSKYFIWYKSNEESKRLFVLLLEMSGYLKHFDGAKSILFLVEDEKVLPKYIQIWSKILKNYRKIIWQWSTFCQKIFEDQNKILQ